MIDIKQNLPKILQQPFWQDFMNACKTELTLLESTIATKVDIFNTRTNITYDNLFELGKTLGYSPDLSIDSSNDNFQKAILAIQFRIKNKTNRISYDYIFKTVPYDGQLFIMYWATTKLLRAAESIGTIDGLLALADPSVPFQYPAIQNYSQFLYSQIQLDTGRILDDPSAPWHLDTLYSTLKTNHIAVEYSIEKLITENSSNYLMTSTYLDYLANAVDYTRKVTEIPHVGCNLSILVDNTEYFDSYVHGSTYSVTDTQVKASVTDTYVEANPATDIVKLVAGTGSQTLPAFGTISPTWPITLANQCISDTFVTDQTNETANWKYAIGRFPANTVTDEAITTGNGTVMTISHTSVYPNIKPYSFKLYFKSSPAVYTVIDDGQQNLLIEGQQTNPIGSIDYTTGAYSFITQVVNTVIKETFGNSSLTELHTYVAHYPIKPGTFKFSFTLTGGNSFTITDDGSGNLIGTGISLGSINYTTGQLDVYFSSSTSTGVDIYATYQYSVDFIVDNGYAITSDYQVTTDLEITEAGLIDSSDNLIAYATFPPIKGGNTRYHIGIQFFIKKGTF